jgi:hypothetical protein
MARPNGREFEAERCCRSWRTNISRRTLMTNDTAAMTRRGGGKGEGGGVVNRMFPPHFASRPPRGDDYGAAFLRSVSSRDIIELSRYCGNPAFRSSHPAHGNSQCLFCPPCFVCCVLHILSLCSAFTTPQMQIYLHKYSACLPTTSSICRLGVRTMRGDYY